MIILLIISIIYVLILIRVLNKDRSDIKGLKIPKWRIQSRGTDTIDKYREYLEKGIKKMKHYAIVATNSQTYEKEFICHCEGMVEAQKKVDELKDVELRDLNVPRYSSIYIIEDEPIRKCKCFLVGEHSYDRDVHSCELYDGNVARLEEIFDEHI